jgi:hypothetical protein
MNDDDKKIIKKSIVDAFYIAMLVAIALAVSVVVAGFIFAIP